METNKENKKVEYIVGITVGITVLLIIIFLLVIILRVLPMYPSYPEVECSLWENGSTWFGEFNCYCPMGDTASYANLKDLNNCNQQYLSHKWNGANYYNELGEEKK
jgi:hypothetical protein